MEPGPGTLELAEAVRPLDELAASWSGLLSRWSWDWFCTATWRPPARSSTPERWTFATRSTAGPEQRAKAWRAWVHGCTLELLECAGIELPRKGWLGPIAWHTRADEPHRSGAFHCHGLVHWPKWVETSLGAVRVQEPHRWTAMQRWARDHGWQRVERPDSGAAVSAYCAKYCAKDAGFGEIHLAGREPAAVQLGAFDGGRARAVPKPRRG